MTNYPFSLLSSYYGVLKGEDVERVWRAIAQNVTQFPWFYIYMRDLTSPRKFHMTTDVSFVVGIFGLKQRLDCVA